MYLTSLSYNELNELKVHMRRIIGFCIFETQYKHVRDGNAEHLLFVSKNEKEMDTST